MMLPLEIKQSGGKLIQHSDLRGGVFLDEASRKIHGEMKLGMWNVRSFIGQVFLRQQRGN